MGYDNEGYAGESGEPARNNNMKMKGADETIVRRVIDRLRRVANNTRFKFNIYFI